MKKYGKNKKDKKGRTVFLSAVIKSRMLLTGPLQTLTLFRSSQLGAAPLGSLHGAALHPVNSVKSVDCKWLDVSDILNVFECIDVLMYWMCGCGRCVDAVRIFTTQTVADFRQWLISVSRFSSGQDALNGPARAQARQTRPARD